MRIDLPDAQWVELYKPEKVPERKRRPVIGALMTFMKQKSAAKLPDFDPSNLDEDKAAAIAAQIDPALLVATDDYNDAVVLALVQDWSFGPVTVEVLLDIPADCYKLISDACAPHVDALMPNFKVSPDPKAPTAP